MHTYPALHNAMWPGLVGKGPDSEPPIDLDTMLDLTAAASVDGVKFDGVDLFLFDPHVSIDSSRRRPEAAGRPDRVAQASSSARSSRRCGRRPAAARRWGATRIARTSSRRCARPARLRKTLNDLGIRQVRRRPHRLGGGPERLGDGSGGQHRRRSRRRSGRRATSPTSYGERLAAEGEICWGGMHSWKRNVELLELVESPEDARLPGRHGAHAALHARLQRARGSHPARGLRLEATAKPSTRR